MAEQYTSGLQKIFYKTTGFRDISNVTVILYDSALNVITTLVLKRAGNEGGDIEGLYYFEYYFSEGVYIAYFHEDGEKKMVQVYNIRKESGGGSRSFLGDNVIGMQN